MKALSSIVLSPVFLRDLRNAKAASKKKALAAPKVNASSASDIDRPSRVVVEARTSFDSPHPSVNKRKAEELFSSDCPSETSSRRPVPGHLFNDGPQAHGRISCPEQPEIRPERRWAEICNSDGWGRQPATAKWAEHVHSQGDSSH